MTTARDLVGALVASGHTVTVLDQRAAANFGDLEANGRQVATPLWVRTGLASIEALPVPHAQLLISVRGPKVVADATYYASLDLDGDGSGGTRFRADLTADQLWTGGVLAHRYEGERALEAVRLAGELRRAVAKKVARNKIPLDGYLELGVCTMAPALVEMALTGKTTLWPLTHDPSLFQEDTEIDRLVQRLTPDGRGGPAPSEERVRGALPWGSESDVPFPHLRPGFRALRR